MCLLWPNQGLIPVPMVCLRVFCGTEESEIQLEKCVRPLSPAGCHCSALGGGHTPSQPALSVAPPETLPFVNQSGRGFSRWSDTHTHTQGHRWLC